MSRPSARLVRTGATTLVSSSPRKRESNGPSGRNGTAGTVGTVGELADPNNGRKAGRTERGADGERGGSVQGGSYLYRITSVVTNDRPRVVGGRRTQRGKRKRKSKRRDRNSCSGHEEGMNHRKVSTAPNADNIATNAPRRDGTRREPRWKVRAIFRLRDHGRSAVPGGSRCGNVSRHTPPGSTGAAGRSRFISPRRHALLRQSRHSRRFVITFD